MSKITNDGLPGLALDAI